MNKKKAKKTSEDGEGEREEPPDYELKWHTVPGKISWGLGLITETFDRNTTDNLMCVSTKCTTYT